MTSSEGPQRGEIVVWTSAKSVLRGMVTSRDEESSSLCILLDPWTDAHAWVPIAECTARDAAGEDLSRADPYLNALSDAARRVSEIAAEFAMRGDFRRCAGATRAYGSLLELMSAARQEP